MSEKKKAEAKKQGSRTKSKEKNRVTEKKPIIGKFEGNVHKAIEFAVKAHEGQVRKGTDIPYIVHPYEAAMIVQKVSDDPNMAVAALLHDTLEDTKVTEEEILDMFGEDVLKLVKSCSEDKSKSWEERKEATVEHLAAAEDYREILISFADKLSNLRSIAQDYRVHGDKTWKKFKRGKEKVCWYYNNLGNIFNEKMGNFTENLNSCEALAEYNRLFQEVFVEFYMDDEKTLMLQMGADEIYAWRMDVNESPYWEEVILEKGVIPEPLKKITYQEAVNIQQARGGIMCKRKYNYSFYPFPTYEFAENVGTARGVFSDGRTFKAELWIEEEAARLRVITLHMSAEGFAIANLKGDEDDENWRILDYRGPEKQEVFAYLLDEGIFTRPDVWEHIDDVAVCTYKDGAGQKFLSCNIPLESDFRYFFDTSLMFFRKNEEEEACGEQV